MTRPASVPIRVVTNLPMAFEGGGFAARPIATGRVRLGDWRALAQADLVVINVEPRLLLGVCSARALTPRGLWRSRVVSIDLVMGPSSDTRAAGLKSRLLRNVDRFIMYIRDTSGFSRSYGIPTEKTEYIPFKVNSIEAAVDRPQTAGEYVLTCGRSYRDFETFCRAMAGMDIPGVILTPPPGGRRMHGTGGLPEIPGNVRVVHDDGSAESWRSHLAGARLLALCITPGTITPSGVSSYLGGMAMGRAVVVTDCPATRGILVDGQEAVIVPPRDAPALRAAIQRLWEDDQAREALADRGRRYALSLGGEPELYANIRRSCLANLPARFPGEGRTCP